MIEVPDGLAVRVQHLRYVTPRSKFQRLYTRYEWRRDGRVPTPRGGVTRAFLLDEKGSTVAEGEAVCSPEDQYVRSLGRDKAVGRAISVYLRSKK